MFRKAFSVVIMELLFLSMIVLAFNVRPTLADTQTIYINADGSITPAGAPIVASDNITYTFTGNISYPTYSGIVVQRSNIIIDGKGYTAQGPGARVSMSTGINLYQRTNVTIQNTQIEAFDYDIWLKSSSRNTISGNNIINSFYGTYLYGSANNTISGNNISGNNPPGNIIMNSYCGTYLYGSANNTISGNNIANNYYGIFLWFSSTDCIVSGNTVTANYIGIYSSSGSTIVSGNTVANDSLYGILLWVCSNNTVSCNEFFGCGLCAADSVGNVVVGNFVNGKPLVYLEGVSNYTVSNAGQVVLVTCKNITVQNLNLSIASDGIWLYATNSCHITNNTLTDNSDVGIFVESSFNNTISSNTATANNVGIALDFSGNNTLRSNVMARNAYNFGVDGASLSDFLDDVDVSNTVDGKPVYYLVNAQDAIVPLDVGYIALINSTRMTVQNLNLTSNVQGILLAYTTNTTLTENNVTNNAWGMYLQSSSHNTLYENNVTNNAYAIQLESSSSCIISGNNVTNNTGSGGGYGIALDNSSGCIVSGNNVTNDDDGGILLNYCSFSTTVYGNTVKNNYYGINLYYSSGCIVSENNVINNFYGVYLDGSSNNTIYHNSFVNNTNQVYARYMPRSLNAWDNGYPSGGNYWSNYTGSDLHSGPYQNITGSDGIGDKPYVIDANNTDHYPLMGPFSSFYSNATQASISCVSNSTVSGFQLSGITISFNVTGEPGTTGFCTLTIPYLTLFPPYTIKIDGNPVSFTTIYEDATQSIIHFTYEHSTHEVTVTSGTCSSGGHFVPYEN
jgi:parallel beta-helix repeat protein